MLGILNSFVVALEIISVSALQVWQAGGKGRKDKNLTISQRGIKEGKQDGADSFILFCAQ